MADDETQAVQSAMPPTMRVDNTRFTFEIAKLCTEWKDGFISTDEFVAETMRWVDCLAQTLHEDKKAKRRAQSKQD